MWKKSAFQAIGEYPSSQESKMKIVAHRGNLFGPDEKKENTLSSIEKCLSLNIEVEIDIFFMDGSFFLGHDYPKMAIGKDFLIRNKNKLWIHCKNSDALFELSKTKTNFFWHQEDDFALTSKKNIWTYPKKKVCEKSIIVCQTKKQTKEYRTKNILGICTDWYYLK